jgi:hypothetical protein
MKRLKLVLWLALAACVAVPVAYAAGKGLAYGGAAIALTSAGNITVTPKANGTVSIGGGTGIKKVLAGTGSLDFGATAAGACDSLTITITGAADGDTVALGIPTALAAADTYQSFHGFVSAPDTVTVKRCNPTNATTALSNPAAATVRATVFKY